MGRNIEVEGGELALRNSKGDIAIIPKKYRKEVQDMIKEGCHDCIDSLVDQLPTTSNYAENGVFIEDPPLTEAQMDSVFTANSDKEFVDRINRKDYSSIQLPNESEPSTHYMRSFGKYVVPSVQRDSDGKLRHYSDEEIRKELIPGGKAFELNTPKKARYFAENYKNSKTWKEYEQGFDSDSAEEDSLVPNWDKVKSTLNPKNWGVDDYTDKGNFDTAYSSARQAGEEEFMWNNKRYSTKKDTDDIYKDNSLNEYSKSKYPNYIKSVNKNLDLKSDTLSSDERANYSSIKNQIYYNDEESFNAELAHEVRKNRNLLDGIKYGIDFNLYGENIYNVPNTEEYETHRFTQPGLAFSREANLSEEDTKKVQNYIGTKADGYFHGESYKALVDKYYNEEEVDNYLKENNYKYYEDDAKSKNLKYPSGDIMANYYLDKISSDKNIKLRSLSNHPYYYFYDSDFEGAYYSNKELSKLDSNKKNFDTLALQRELSNRGYKLPKSTKKDGDFDGIFGDETSKALLDYQNKKK